VSGLASSLALATAELKVVVVGLRVRIGIQIETGLTKPGQKLADRHGTVRVAI
jgi:hypothetical protein